MFPATALLATLSLALTVAANPLVVRDSLITLPIAKRVNATGTVNLLQRDLARVRSLRAKGEATAKGVQSDTIVSSVPATNQAFDYVVSVQIGTPPTTYALLVDTGSSNTWVGSRSPYVQTSTSVQTRDTVSVDYGSGSFSGVEFTDHVSLNSGLNVFGQSIGAATTSSGFDDVDGILGLGPTDLTIGTLSPDTTSTVPTVTDNLFAQGVISENLVAISFEPTTSATVTNGEVTFGGTDSSRFTGSITFSPITSTSPSSQFWGLTQSIRYGTSTSILSTTAGILDTGTTLTLIATDAFARYQTATGGVPDAATTLLKISATQFANLQSLFFVINGVTFEFTANAQIWPRALNSLIGGDANSIYLIVQDIGSNTGSGLDFINGMTFLERFYSVYDTANSRVGVANTPFTRATTN